MRRKFAFILGRICQCICTAKSISDSLDFREIKYFFIIFTKKSSKRKMIKIDFIKRKYTYILKFSKKKKYSGISFLKTILVIKTLKVLFKRIVIYFKGKYKKERSG